MVPVVLAAGTLWSAWLPEVRAEAQGPAAAPLTFEADVRPIFKAHCFHCHGEGGKTKGDVDLRLRRHFVGDDPPSDLGSESTPNAPESEPPVLAGRPDASLLLAVVRSGEMPKEGKSLTADEIATIENWIAQGAPTAREEPAEVPDVWITEEERAFWAFQPIVRPPVPAPASAESDRVRTPVDGFLLERLRAAGLPGFAPDADRPTLLRRLALDLTGLPPTPDEIAAFLADESPDAWERQVDRLLASPHYGERWARHWLDVAGYADSNGGSEEDSPRPHAWRYRDYVIRALNDDKPWDAFIVEQLAGDELASVHADSAAASASTDPRTAELLAATGFLRLAPDPTGDNPPDPNLARNQVVADSLHVMAKAFLGLTLDCARCHDHRYDPIPQRDYYRLRAVFEPAFDWKGWRNPAQRLVSLYTEADRAAAAACEARAAVFDRDAADLDACFKHDIFEQRVRSLPEGLQPTARQVRATPPNERTPEQQQFLKEHPEVNVDAGSLDLFDRPAFDMVQAVRAKAAEARNAKPPEPFVMGVNERAGQVPVTQVFHRGDHDQPMDAVTPGELTVLGGNEPPVIPEDDEALATSGRRLAYARWLASGRHPLTARVLVNRFWMHHFGRGLVATPGDFGRLGQRPTHPDLLDWLAAEFVEGAGGAGRPWSLKALHRLIVTSTAYRQASEHDASRDADPDNHLLGRFPLHRLDAEAIRDAMLSAAGILETTPFGEPVPVGLDLSGRVTPGRQIINVNGESVGVDPVGDGARRRSVYLETRRKFPVTALEVFDAPVMSPNCDQRAVSTVAPQALFMLNDTFAAAAATALATRVRGERPGDLRGQVSLAWELACARPISAPLLDRTLAFLAEQTETLRAFHTQNPPGEGKPAPDPALEALASACQAILSGNAFLYVD